jgi:hypothetical protein
MYTLTNNFRSQKACCHKPLTKIWMWRGTILKYYFKMYWLIKIGKNLTLKNCCLLTWPTNPYSWAFTRDSRENSWPPWSSDFLNKKLFEYKRNLQIKNIIVKIYIKLPESTWSWYQLIQLYPWHSWQGSGWH